MAFCSACGNEIKDSVNFCQDCGATQSQSEFIDEPKDWIVTLLLSFFLGCLGVHRFYTGHTGIGVAQLLTLGGCGIWAFIDFIIILVGNFKDAQGGRPCASLTSPTNMMIKSINAQIPQPPHANNLATPNPLFPV